MKALTSLLAATFALLALPVMAQEVTTTVTAEPNPPLKRTAVEVRPLETLASTAPGIAAGGATVETYLRHNWALTAGGSYGDIDLPRKYTTTAIDKTKKPAVARGYGYSAGAGVRYYFDPIGDSAYAGASLDYSENHTGWDYRDESYSVTQYAVTPSLAAGYRWVWQNGFLARVGAGAGLPSVQSEKVVAKTEGKDMQEGLDKLNDIVDTKVMAKLDLGVGMMF